jgi:uncharacterized protein YkwD
MIKWGILVAFLFSLALVSCQKEDIKPVETTPVEPEAPAGPAIVYNVNKAKMLELVNNVRRTGCNCGNTAMPPVAAVTWNDRLARAAFDHSADMQAHEYFSHTGLNGSNAGQRMIAAGYNWRAYGENIAKGYANEQAVINGWLGSEGHCRNIMNAGFREMGVGRQGDYWTQLFGSR